MAELGAETLRILETAALHEQCEQVDGSDYVPVSMLILAIRELKADRERIRELRQQITEFAEDWKTNFEQYEERIRELKQGLAEFRRGLYEWSQAYPTDVFLEPPPGQHGKTVDACSAAMGRYVTRKLLEDFDERIPLEP